MAGVALPTLKLSTQSCSLPKFSSSMAAEGEGATSCALLGPKTRMSLRRSRLPAMYTYTLGTLLGLSMRSNQSLASCWQSSLMFFRPSSKPFSALPLAAGSSTSFSFFHMPVFSSAAW